ncbi:transposase [Neptunicoccus sediminis]|uniref:transposase n=1 Tax=Neptunicoccus sediminis TaxID=1892596 RepID=UPI000AEB51DB
MAKRRNFTDQFKAKMALEALRGDKTVQEIAAKHQLHPNQVSTWKRQAIDGMADVFSGGKQSGPTEAEVKELHAKIGRLAVVVIQISMSRGRGTNGSFVSSFWTISLVMRYTLTTGSNFRDHLYRVNPARLITNRQHTGVGKDAMRHWIEPSLFVVYLRWKIQDSNPQH